MPKSAKTLPPAAEGQDEDDELAEVMQAVDASASRKLFEHILDTYYVPLELWYTRTIIDKVGVQITKSIYVLTLVLCRRINYHNLT